MKKILGSLLIVVFIFIAGVTHAYTAPTLEDLQAQLASLVKLLAQLQSTTVSSVPAPAVSPAQTTGLRPILKNGKFDYTSYEKKPGKTITIGDYEKTPFVFLNKPITIKFGKIVNFNSMSSAGGAASYIEIVEYPASTEPPFQMNLRFSNSEEFATAAKKLNIGDIVIAYGAGASNVEFNVVGNGGSYDSSEAVMEVHALKACDSGDGPCNTNKDASFGYRNVFSKKN
jgi:hypothetical protein